MSKRICQYCGEEITDPRCKVTCGKLECKDKRKRYMDMKWWDANHSLYYKTRRK